MSQITMVDVAPRQIRCSRISVFYMERLPIRPPQHSTIPIIEPTGIKFSALINLDKNWNYEYKVLRTDDKQNHTTDNGEEDQVQRGEHVLRKALETTKENPENLVNQTDSIDGRDKSSKDPAVGKASNLNNVEEKKSSTKTEDSGIERSLNTESGYESKLDVSDENNKVLRRLKDSKSKEFRGRNRDRATDVEDNYEPEGFPNIKNYNIQGTVPAKLTLLVANKPILASELSKEVDTSSIRLAKASKSPKALRHVSKKTARNKKNVTRLVKDDEKITKFTNNLRIQTLKVFDSAKKKTDQEHLKNFFKKLGRRYDEKFKEFLRDTGDHQIKTKLGTQKVVLNTIETSNLIVRRLMNFWNKEMEEEGILRHNADTAQQFKQAVEKQEVKNMELACKNLNICRSKSSFSSFLTNILDILMECKDGKFKQTIDALTEETTSEISTVNILPDHTKKKLLRYIGIIEKQPVQVTRAMINIFKNTVINKNKPMIASLLPTRQGIVKTTLAMLEIMNIFDKKIIDGKDNEWSAMTNSFRDFKDDKRDDVQSIASKFVKHVKKNLLKIDSINMASLVKNLNIMLG